MADAKETLEVTLQWGGLYPLCHIDYTDQADDVFRKLAKGVHAIPDLDLDRRGLYILVSGEDLDDDAFEIDEIMLLGAAYTNDIRERVGEKKAQFKEIREMALEAREKDIYLAHAHITSVTDGKLPKFILSDLQSALIYHHEPVCNLGGQDNYKPRDNYDYVIKNEGEFDPLDESIDTRKF